MIKCAQAHSLLGGLADQKAPDSIAKNKRMLDLYKEIGRKAGNAQQTVRGELAEKERETDPTASIEKIIEFVSALVVGDVIMKTTADTLTHPSPTARINAAAANKTGCKTWMEIARTADEGKTAEGKTPDTNTMLRKAGMCLLYKLEGTTCPKWRATAQLMNWVTNGIPILAGPLMLDIFPHWDLKKRDRKEYTNLLNTATAKQWTDRSKGEEEMIKILTYTQEQWESGKNVCEETLKMLVQQPLAKKIRELNALFLLWAVTSLAQEDVGTMGRKNKEDKAKTGAKDMLRQANVPGTHHFLATSEVEYDGPKLETAIRRAEEKGKTRLATLLKEAFEADKKGKSKGISEMFGGRGTNCPDCEKTGVEKLIILDTIDPARRVHEHLYHCGEVPGKNSKRRDSPITVNEVDKRSRQDMGPMRNLMTPPRGTNQRGRGARGNPFGRGAFHSPAPRGYQEMEIEYHHQTNQGPGNQGPVNSRQGAHGNHRMGLGYQTQGYKNQQMNNQQNQGNWDYMPRHNM